jgi:hypothetical protein
VETYDIRFPTSLELTPYLVGRAAGADLGDLRPEPAHDAQLRRGQ